MAFNLLLVISVLLVPIAHHLLAMAFNLLFVLAPQVFKLRLACTHIHECVSPSESPG